MGVNAETIALPVVDDNVRHWADGSAVRFCSSDCQDWWWEMHAENAERHDRPMWVHELGRCGCCGHRRYWRDCPVRCDCFEATA